MLLLLLFGYRSLSLFGTELPPMASHEIVRGSAYEKARGSLPVSLHGIFDELVDAYRFHCTVISGRPFVAYLVLAELVRDGWRPSKDGEIV